VHVDLWEEGGAYRLWRCGVCRTESWKPTVNDGVTAPSEYWDLQRFESYEGHDVISEYRARYDRLGAMTSLTPQQLAETRIADWGGGIGNLATWAKELGATDVLVLDTDDRALAIARDRGLKTCLVDSLGPDQVFDVIFAIDVIEHVVDPGAFLNHLRGRLSPDGVIVLETPSAQFWMRSLARREQPPILGKKLRRYLYYFEHKHYFSVSGLIALARSCELQVNACQLVGSPRSKIAAAVVHGDSMLRRGVRSVVSVCLAVVGRRNKIWICLAPTK
jgi:2-polyprenyl-3-methyl-5-hydroxy-6-metoxy-1,4-benzoquinol methylase